MRRPRRNHSPAYKARVVLEALRGEKSVAELAKKYDAHPTRVEARKNELLQRAAEMFGGTAAEGSADPEKDRELHVKFGELTVEGEFLGHSPDCVDMLPGAHPLGRSYARGYRTYSSVQTWLSPVVNSTAFQPNYAKLIGSR